MYRLYGVIAVILSVLLFNSCSDEAFWQRQTQEPEPEDVSFDSLYGNYLAGQLAWLRNDYLSSSEYLSKAYERDKTNKKLLERLYVIYAINGNIEKAAEYATLAEQDGDKSNIIYVIRIVNNMLKSDYKGALIAAKGIQSNIRKLILPTTKVWAKAGMGKKDKAFATLEKLKIEGGDEINDYYIFNKAMLYEYFGMKEEAKAEYERFIEISGRDLSFYNYSAIMEFYVRNGYLTDALDLSDHVRYSGNMQETKSQYTKNLLSGKESSQYHKVSPQIAISDMLIYTSAWLARIYVNPETIYFYMRMAAYLNSDNVFLQYLIAMHLDYFGQTEEAVRYYDGIKSPEYVRYAAQIRIADIYINKNEYEKAENLLKKLQREYPEKEELHFKLGDILRISGKNEEAFAYYSMLMKDYPEKYRDDWGIYYALAATCDSGGNIAKAEEYLQKALALSKDNPIVQNHLGYLWLDNDKNISEAFELVAKALHKNPHEAHIIDSMGWAFFKIGDTKRAIAYLEAAVAKDSGNALMNDHLGDAYWAGGRKNEAIFQWNHAMDLKEDAEEVNKDVLRQKIKNGFEYKPITNYNYLQIKKLIKEFKL